MTRILSGIQPTGDKHIGNLVGAIQQYVALQDLGDAYYCVVDLHALTSLPDPTELRRATLKTAALLIAAGLDIGRCTLFVQSHVAAQHTELAWLLNCVASYGQLTRMTQFKDKSEQRDHVSVGLFTYPILQAADILLYDADIVPIGEDQKQHLELTRDIAERFNARYGPSFVAPAPRLAKVGARICDLQCPTTKMSTSDQDQKGTLNVLDEPDLIVSKVMSAVTDDGREVRAAADKPGITNLLEIMSGVSGRPVRDLEDQYRHGGYGVFKSAVAEALVETLRPIRQLYRELMADTAQLESQLAVGAEKARSCGERKIEQIRRAMGCGC
ncbi:MAG: tryptophan--tRNA ligase [Pirellulaceae bacterium]|jgi:tryptophanyl-tRNA synthetase|nr:tryptophan--tRNA ligase [Pirellulaceae bacterium]